MAQEACPKCGKPYSATAESCPACGVIFAKLRDVPRPPSPAPPQVFTPIRPPAPPAPRFSLPRGLLHLGGFALLFLLLGVGLAALGWIPATEVAGKALGRLATPLFVLAVVASYAHQTERGGLYFLSVGAIVAGLGFFLFLMISMKAPPPSQVVTFSALELRDLARRSSRICNPVMGFSFPDPGQDFVDDPETQSQLNLALRQKAQGLHAWALADPRGGAAILVEVAKGLGDTPTSLQSFAFGMRRGVVTEGAVVQGEGFPLVEGRHSYFLAVDFPNGAQADVRCIASGPDRSPPVIVCLQTAAASRQRLQTVVAGLALRGCEG